MRLTEGKNLFGLDMTEYQSKTGMKKLAEELAPSILGYAVGNSGKTMNELGRIEYGERALIIRADIPVERIASEPERISYILGKMGNVVNTDPKKHPHSDMRIDVIIDKDMSEVNLHSPLSDWKKPIFDAVVTELEKKRIN